jgi:hypothetical protein
VSGALFLHAPAVIQQGGAEGFRLAETGDDMHVENMTELGRRELQMRERRGYEPVFLMEGSRHAVGIDVAAQQNRLELLHAVTLPRGPRMPLACRLTAQ